MIAGVQEQGLAVSWLRKSSNPRDKVNDFYGNQAGDQVLAEISKVLNKQLRIRYVGPVWRAQNVWLCFWVRKLIKEGENSEKLDTKIGSIKKSRGICF